MYTTPRTLYGTDCGSCGDLQETTSFDKQRGCGLLSARMNVPKDPQHSASSQTILIQQPDSSLPIVSSTHKADFLKSGMDMKAFAPNKWAYTVVGKPQGRSRINAADTCSYYNLASSSLPSTRLTWKLPGEFHLQRPFGSFHVSRECTSARRHETAPVANLERSVDCPNVTYGGVGVLRAPMVGCFFKRKPKRNHIFCWGANNN